MLPWWHRSTKKIPQSRPWSYFDNQKSSFREYKQAKYNSGTNAAEKKVSEKKNGHQSSEITFFSNAVKNRPEWQSISAGYNAPCGTVSPPTLPSQSGAQLETWGRRLVVGTATENMGEPKFSGQNPVEQIPSYVLIKTEKNKRVCWENQKGRKMAREMDWRREV